MILLKRKKRVVVGVPARLTTLSRHSGHGRVWGEVLDRLNRMTNSSSARTGPPTSGSTTDMTPILKSTVLSSPVHTR